MKKTTVIIVAVCYIASIALISFFGINVSVLDAVVPVTSVLCTNESDNNSTVDEMDGYTRIKVKFTTAGDATTLTGTMLTLCWRVLPDDASNSDVVFIYSEDERAEFITDDDGNEIGMILFSGTTVLDLKIQASDGSKVYCSVRIIVY